VRRLNAARLSPPSGQPRSSAMVHRRAPGVGEVVSPGLWARLSLPAVHAAVHKGTAPAAAKRAVKLRWLISPPSVSPASIRLACGCAHGESRRACDSAKMSAAPVVASWRNGSRTKCG